MRATAWSRASPSSSTCPVCPTSTATSSRGPIRELPNDSAGTSEARRGQIMDKTTTLDAAVAEIESGMTIGIGGWGSRRKPMAFVRALLRTDVRDLTVVTYGGPDIGLLCAAGKVKRVYYGFVSLDSPPFYDPWFGKARTSGSIESREMDEGML